MATRRARIKAIVNVPARRAKANEESTNSKPAKLPDSSDVNKLPNPPDKNIVNPDQDVDVKVCSAKECPGAENTLPSFQDGSVSSLGVGKSVGDISNDCNSDNLNPLVKIDEVIQGTTNLSPNESKNNSDDKKDELNSVCKSSPEESTCDSSVDIVEINNRKNKEIAPLNSPIKQRPRLFIRPSPKLVDAGGRRRFPSGTRHKASSESEEETRTRSSTIEDAESQVAESSSRPSNSLQEKISKPQETLTTSSNDTSVGDTKKAGSRPGRRAKNKENRASDFRRRLLQKMKKGNGSAPLDRTRLTMFDYIYYNPISNPMRSSSESSATKEKESVLDGDLGNSLAEEQVDDPGEGGSLLVEGQSNEKTQISHDKDVEAEADDGGMPAPRVKVGPDGELILDEQSLVIETTGLKEGLQDLAKGPALVESSSFTNYATYSKRTKGHEWSENETLRFYRALNVVGTDFTLMQSLLFTSRSRRDLKNKFKREERRNPSLIERALLNPGVFSNVEELQSEFAKTDPPEKDKAESKRGRGRGKSRGGKRTAQKDGRPPAKKKKRKNWLVNGNESQGEESEDNVSVASDHKKELDFPVEKNRESTLLPPPDDVVYNVSSEEAMMGSQEIVITNVDSPTGSSVKEASQRDHCESENGVDDDSDDAESVSSESQFLSRVLQPTRSGRVPKRREVDNGYQNSHKKAIVELGSQKQVTRKVNVKVSDSKSQPLRPDMKTEVIVCSKEPEERSSMEDSRQPVAIELTECSSNPTLSMDRISGMDPGSLVVIATSAPDDPSRKVYQVFMVSPRVEGQDSLLIPQSFSAEIKPEMFGEEGDEVSAPIVPVENVAGDCTGAGSVEFPPEGLESCSADGVMKPNLHEET